MSTSLALELQTNWRDKGTRRREAIAACEAFEYDKLAGLLETHLQRQNPDGVAGRTLRTYRSALRHFVDFAKPSPDESPRFALRHCDPDWVSEFLRDLKDSGLATPTRKVYLNGVRALFEALLWADVVPNNPALRVKPPKDKRDLSTVRRMVSDRERRTLLEYLDRASRLSKAEHKQERLEALHATVLVRLIYNAGLRVGSAVSVFASDLLEDEEGEDFLFVRKAKGKRQYKAVAPQPLQEAIFRWLPVREKIAQPGAPLLVNVATTDPRFRGGPMSTDSARRALKKAYERAGIPEAYEAAHAFRHAAVNRVLDITGDPYLAQNVAGHLSIRTTEEIYIKHRVGRLKPAVRALED